MPGMEGMGKILIAAGLMTVVVGILFVFGAKFGFGRMPGDIVFQKGNFSFYFPIVSSIIISLLLTLAFSFFNRR